MRALESGRARDRALAWGGAVLAYYAHPVFAPLLPAVGLTCLFAARARNARYSTRQVLGDAALALVLALPALAHAVLVFGRRGEVSWVRDANWAVLGSALTTEQGVVVTVAALGLALSLLRRGPAAEATTAFLRRRRGPLAGVALVALGPIALATLLYALGSNVLDERYLALSELAGVLAVAAVVSRLPVALGAAALVLLAWCPFTPGVDPEHPDRPDYGRAAATLDVVAPRGTELVLFHSGFVEGNEIARGREIAPLRRSFLEAPLEVRLRQRGAGRAYTILPFEWTDKATAGYLEATVLPRVRLAPELFLVATPSVLEGLHRVARRAPARRVRARASARRRARDRGRALPPSLSDDQFASQ